MERTPSSERPPRDDSDGATEAGDEPVLPPLDARWLTRIQGTIGASGVAAGALVAATGAAIPGAFIAAASAVQVGFALVRRRADRGRQLLGAARDAADLGRIEEAEALLDRAARQGVPARRAVAAVRATIQLDRDDPAGAAVLASGAIGTDEPRRPDGAVWVAVVEALGVRALARAATGDAEGASDDAARIGTMLDRGTDMGVEALGAGQVIDEARARAALARALGHVRSGDRDALRAHLAEHEVLIRALVRPRERALLRGVERMLATDRASPYRGRAESDRAAEPSDDWVATMLPAVAPFVPPRSVRGGGSIPDVAVTGLAPARGDWSSARRIALLIASWIAVAGVAFGANFLDVPVYHRSLVFMVTMLVPMLYVAGILAFAIGRGFGSVARRQTLADAIVLYGSTGDARYVEAMTKAPEPLLAAQAMLVLARRKNLAGAFDEARDLAEAGLARTRSFLRHAESGIDLRPALTAELALAHAGLGDVPQALARVESIDAGWAHRARARFGVRLVALAASGDLVAATALAERRPADLPLDRPIEALADVLRARAEKSSMGLAERTRLTADLRHGAELRAWVERIVPKIVDEMDLDPVSGQRVAVRIAAAAPGAEPDVDAEYEAAATTEAEQAPGGVRRRRTAP